MMKQIKVYWRWLRKEWYLAWKADGQAARDACVSEGQDYFNNRHSPYS